MINSRSKLVNRFCKVLNGNPKTENIPLNHGNLTVSVREFDRFEKQNLQKQGFKIDPDKRMRCLYVEGKIAVGGNSHKKEYYVQYKRYRSDYAI